jgi:hypothetical protein
VPIAGRVGPLPRLTRWLGLCRGATIGVPEPVPSFTEALCAFETLGVFMYAHDITERDHSNIVNIESLLFNLKRKGATEQMKINDFLKRK